MTGDGSDSNLNQASRQPLFHNARHGTGMREPVAIQLVIEIRVCVKMKDSQLLKVCMKTLDNGPGDRMVAAKTDERPVRPYRLAHRSLNRGKSRCYIPG